jgi:hypothetical protein
MISQKTSRRMNAGVSESFLFTFGLIVFFFWDYGLIVGLIAEGLKRSCLPWTRWYCCPTRLRVSECLDHIHIRVDYSGHPGDSVITWTSENTKKTDRSGFQWPSPRKQKVAKSHDGRSTAKSHGAWSLSLCFYRWLHQLFEHRVSGEAWAGILGNKWVGSTNTTAIWANFLETNGIIIPKASFKLYNPQASVSCSQ